MQLARCADATAFVRPSPKDVAHRPLRIHQVQAKECRNLRASCRRASVLQASAAPETAAQRQAEEELPDGDYCMPPDISVDNTEHDKFSQITVEVRCRSFAERCRGDTDDGCRRLPATLNAAATVHSTSTSALDCFVAGFS